MSIPLTLCLFIFAWGALFFDHDAPSPEPEGLTVGVWGDFTRTQVETQVSELLHVKVGSSRTIPHSGYRSGLTSSQQVTWLG